MGIKIECRIFTARQQGMNVDAGTTVNSLRNMLYAANHDTARAHARVFRDGDIYIGRLNGFVLKEGDEVEFNTESWSERPAVDYNRQPVGRCTCRCGGAAPSARPAPQQPAKKPTTIEELWDALHDDIEDIKSDIDDLGDAVSNCEDNIGDLQDDMENFDGRLKELEDNAGLQN